MWPFSSFRKKIKASLPTDRDTPLALVYGEVLWVHLSGQRIRAKVLDFNETHALLLAPSTDCSNTLGLNTFSESRIIVRRECIAALERPYPSEYTK